MIAAQLEHVNVYLLYIAGPDGARKAYKSSSKANPGGDETEWWKVGGEKGREVGRQPSDDAVHKLAEARGLLSLLSALSMLYAQKPTLDIFNLLSKVTFLISFCPDAAELRSAFSHYQSYPIHSLLESANSGSDGASGLLILFFFSLISFQHSISHLRITFHQLPGYWD